MPASRLSPWSVSLALAVALAAASSRGFADDPKPWAGAEAAVASAEKDGAQRAAARVVVDAAIKENPAAVGPQLLSARLWVVEARAAKKSAEIVAAFNQALASCSAAQALDPRDPAPWRMRVDVLTQMGAARDEVTEAMRALAVRQVDDPKARDEFKARTAKLPALKAGDPMPLVVWKDSAGKDVSVADLWTSRPLVIELFRTTQWCEVCRRRLFELHDHAKDFENENVTVVAVSPDGGEKLATIEKDGLKGRKPLKLRLLCDPKGTQADRLGVLNYETVKPDVAEDAFGLPYPTTIIVDTKGIIRFVETHGDFKNRTKYDEIMSELRKMKAPAGGK